MRLRRLIKWIFGALSLLAGIVFAANVENLLAVNGWNTFLTKGLSQEATAPYVQLIGPGAIITAVAILAFTLGLWTDDILAKIEARTPPRRNKYKTLGDDAIALAEEIKWTRADSTKTDHSVIFAKINSIYIRFQKMEFGVPRIPATANTAQRLWIIEQFLIKIGILLQDGHVSEAKNRSYHPIPLQNS